MSSVEKETKNSLPEERNFDNEDVPLLESKERNFLCTEGHNIK